MKKILWVFLSIFLVCGCTIGPANTPTKAVEEYLDRYINNDDVILAELDEYVQGNSAILDEHKDTYKEVLRKQYGDLKYEIKEETYNGDTANVEVKITVYDLHTAQIEAQDYLTNHPEEFNDEAGNYNEKKFMKYRLDKMKDTTKTIDYTLNLTVQKNNNIWEVNQLSNDDLQKIHGIYNYDASE